LNPELRRKQKLVGKDGELDSSYNGYGRIGGERKLVSVHPIDEDGEGINLAFSECY